MKITPENPHDIVVIITNEFRSFGGIRIGDNNNPIARALSDCNPQFAAGVSIDDVVNRVIQLTRIMYNGKD